MKVLICGAGQVGYSIASYLAIEDNDVTVVDSNPYLISQINDDLDVNGIVGHIPNPDVMDRAGADQADMIIAVTNSDEVNMVACQIGHSLFSIPKKIARIREQSYLDPAWSNLFSRAHMPIDVIVSPEVIVANDIFKRLSVPGTTYVIPLAKGKLHLVGLICYNDCPLLDTPLRQLTQLFPDLNAEILAIHRDNKPIIPNADECMLAGDEVYFVVDTNHLRRAMVAFGHNEQEARRLVILGGGAVALYLVKMLHNYDPGLQIKIIESNQERAQYLSEELDDVIVLYGDGLDKELLEEAGIGATEAMIAITNDDESNILGSLLAKQYGAERVITLINKNAYMPLVGPMGIDAVVSPRAITVSNIMQHVRRGRIKELHNLRDGFAEVIEAEATDASGIVNIPIQEMNLSSDIRFGAIIHKGEILMPRPETVIKPGDQVIILAAKGKAPEVEKLFSVQVDLF